VYVWWRYILYLLGEVVQAALGVQARVSDGGLMAGTEAADESEVIRDFKYFFDFVELESALANVVLVIDRVLNQRGRSLEYIL